MAEKILSWSKIVIRFMEPLGINRDEARAACAPPLVERRGRLRHKIHTPAYASLERPSSKIVLDLNEITDISEDGVCIQSSSVLNSTGPLDIRLELAGHDAPFLVGGEVVWSNHAGRAGIRFAEMHPELRHQLKQWIFLNVIVGCANFAAAEEVKKRSPQNATEFSTQDANPEVIGAEPYPAVLADHTAVLAGIAAVEREVERLSDDLDCVLNLICQRVIAFCGATASAIALDNGVDLLCRASAGVDAPTLGVQVDREAGFSGQCIRTGQILCCDDSETDDYADRAACRALGIRSIIAAPIFVDGGGQARNNSFRTGPNRSVAGLIEVFAPEPNAFDENADLILKSMAEMVSGVIERNYGNSAGPGNRAYETHDASPFPAQSGLDASGFSGSGLRGESTAASEIFAPAFTPLRRGLLAAAAITIVAVGAWLLSPRKISVAAMPTNIAMPVQPKSDMAAAQKTLHLTPTLDQERELAQKGDATSQFAIGVHYATGDGVKQDYTQAVHWFALAAEQGHVGAQETLGAYYWAARGVPQDLTKAYFWSLLAQAGGDEASKYRVAILASRMTHNQILAAQQQADDWLKQHQIASNKNHP